MRRVVDVFTYRAAQAVREAIAARLRFLGPFDVRVVTAREDVVAARAARELLPSP